MSLKDQVALVTGAGTGIGEAVILALAEAGVELLAGAWDRGSIRRNYPNLTEERICAVLAYAAQTFRDDGFHLLPSAKDQT